MTSNHHALYDLGYTRTTMAVNRGRRHREVKRTPKNGPSSDWSLQLDSMKLELLVIANQPCRGEYVPGPCTHRPSNHESWQHPKPVV